MGSEKIEVIDKTYTLNKENLRINSPEFLVLHSTYSYKGFEDLWDCHKRKGFAGVGYHLFVSEDKKVYQARPYNLEGAHAIGFNTKSIGVSFYSNLGTPSKEVIDTTRELIFNIIEEYPKIKIISHTQAQFIYLNELLNKQQIKIEFPTNKYIVKKSLFNEVIGEVKKLEGMIPHPSKIEKQILNLRNCPGEAFLYIV